MPSTDPALAGESAAALCAGEKVFLFPSSSHRWPDLARDARAFAAG